MKILPKTISFFWGNETMSWMRYLTLYSFRKLNPNWKIELYYSLSPDIKEMRWKSREKQDYFYFKGKDYFQKVKDLDIDIIEWTCMTPNGITFNVDSARKGDFFKYEKLSKSGGIYSDLDILFVKSMDEIYPVLNNYDISVCYRNGYWSIGFMTSKGNNLFFEEVWKNSFSTFSPSSYQSAGIISIKDMLSKKFNVHPNIDCLINNYKDISIFNLPMNFFYPFTWDNVIKIFKENNDVPEDCIGIHWFAGNEISQQFNNVLTEDTYQTYNNTFCNFVKKIINREK